MKLGTQLLLPSLVTAVVALCCGGVNSLLLNREAADTAKHCDNDIVQLRAITGTQAQLGRTHAGVYRTFSLIGSMDDGQLKAYRAEVGQQVQAMQAAVTQVSASLGDKPELVKDADELKTHLAQYAKHADQAIDLASVDPNTGVAALQTADQAFTEAAQRAGTFVQNTQADAQAAQAASMVRSNRIALLLGLLSLSLTGAALAFGARILRQLLQALRDTTQVAEAVAQGDMSPRALQARGDEIGDLQRSMAQMVERLRSSLLDVRHSASNIANASTEIATGNQDLSLRTEQAASNLQEAASSMEHLTALVRQSADAPAQANQLASSASAVAERDGIGQVNSAVTQLDQMTQQNAALVEESAAAADSLRLQAQRLSDLVAGFKLGAETAPAASAPHPVVAPAPTAHEQATKTAIRTAKAGARAATTPAAPKAPPAAQPPRWPRPATIGSHSDPALKPARNPPISRFRGTTSPPT